MQHCRGVEVWSRVEPRTKLFLGWCVHNHHFFISLKTTLVLFEFRERSRQAHLLVVMSYSGASEWQVEKGHYFSATRLPHSYNLTVASQLAPPVEINTGLPLQFFHLLSILKSKPRTGWLRNGISSPGMHSLNLRAYQSLTDFIESIADHMYRMSMLALFSPPSITSRLDIVKVTKMCLFHDEYSPLPTINLWPARLSNYIIPVILIGYGTY